MGRVAASGYTAECEVTAPLDPIVANARIVSPEEGARDPVTLITTKLLLTRDAAAGITSHVVKFADGVVALVPGDPRDTATWHAKLAETHAAAIRGEMGPVHVATRRRP